MHWKGLFCCLHPPPSPPSAIFHDHLAALLHRFFAVLYRSAMFLHTFAAFLRRLCPDQRRIAAFLRWFATDLRYIAAFLRNYAAMLRRNAAYLRNTAAVLCTSAAILRRNATDLRNTAAVLCRTAAFLRRNAAEHSRTAIDRSTTAADLCRKMAVRRVGEPACAKAEPRQGRRATEGWHASLAVGTRRVRGHMPAMVREGLPSTHTEKIVYQGLAGAALTGTGAATPFGVENAPTASTPFGLQAVTPLGSSM